MERARSSPRWSLSREHAGSYLFKLPGDYAREQGRGAEDEYKTYFRYHRLHDIVMYYSMSKGLSADEVERQRSKRAILIDFLGRLLVMDSSERLTAEQALDHPFVAGTSQEERERREDLLLGDSSVSPHQAALKVVGDWRPQRDLKRMTRRRRAKRMQREAEEREREREEQEQEREEREREEQEQEREEREHGAGSLEGAPASRSKEMSPESPPWSPTPKTTLSPDSPTFSPLSLNSPYHPPPPHHHPHHHHPLPPPALPAYYARYPYLYNGGDTSQDYQEEHQRAAAAGVEPAAQQHISSSLPAAGSGMLMAAAAAAAGIHPPPNQPLVYNHARYGPAAAAAESARVDPPHLLHNHTRRGRYEPSLASATTTPAPNLSQSMVSGDTIFASLSVSLSACLTQSDFPANLNFRTTHTQGASGNGFLGGGFPGFPGFPAAGGGQHYYLASNSGVNFGQMRWPPPQPQPQPQPLPVIREIGPAGSQTAAGTTAGADRGSADGQGFRLDQAARRAQLAIGEIQQGLSLLPGEEEGRAAAALAQQWQQWGYHPHHHHHHHHHQLMAMPGVPDMASMAPMTPQVSNHHFVQSVQNQFYLSSGAAGEVMSRSWSHRGHAFAQPPQAGENQVPRPDSPQREGDRSKPNAGQGGQGSSGEPSPARSSGSRESGDDNTFKLEL